MRVARHAEINNNREKERGTQHRQTGRETTHHVYPLILSPWRRLTFVGHPERKGKRKKNQNKAKEQTKIGNVHKTQLKDNKEKR